MMLKSVYAHIQDYTRLLVTHCSSFSSFICLLLLSVQVSSSFVANSFFSTVPLYLLDIMGWIEPVVFLLGVIMGTGSTLTIKIIYGLEAIGVSGEYQRFE